METRKYVRHLTAIDFKCILKSLDAFHVFRSRLVESKYTFVRTDTQAQYFYVLKDSNRLIDL